MILPVGTIFGGNFGQFGEVARQLFLPNTAGNRADEETASTKTLALQAKVAQDRQTLLKELRLRALQFNDNRFQQQVRVGPFIFRINPYPDVFAAQVFVNDAFMCPVLIYEIQAAIGRLGEEDLVGGAGKQVRGQGTTARKVEPGCVLAPSGPPASGQ